MATLTWLGHASFRLDTDGGKRIYVDPWLSGPTCPDSEREPGARRRDRGHARSRRPRRRRGRDCSRSSACKVAGMVELMAWLAANGVPDDALVPFNKGGTVEHRRRPAHADERIPLELGARRHVHGRAGGVRHPRRRHVDLLRRRHLRLRRHAADRAALPAAGRGAADRRPLHDGAGGGRGRAGAARATRAACRATGEPSRCSRARPTRSPRSRSRRSSSIEPGDTVEL